MHLSEFVPLPDNLQKHDCLSMEENRVFHVTIERKREKKLLTAKPLWKKGLRLSKCLKV